MKILCIGIPYGKIIRMGRRRLFLSPLLFCCLVEDPRSTNKGFFWSNESFGGIRGRCRLGSVHESRSHGEEWDKFGLAFPVFNVLMVALLAGEEELEEPFKSGFISIAWRGGANCRVSQRRRSIVMGLGASLLILCDGTLRILACFCWICMYHSVLAVIGLRLEMEE